MRLRFTTAGESHGKALVAIVEGLPAGLPVSADWVDRDLARRMQGYGRGARMKIERDRVEWLAGIRAGETLGSPVAMLIPNRDWSNWEDVMVAGRRRRDPPPPGDAAAPRSRRPGGRAQVRPARRAGHPRAGQCPGDHRAGGGGRAGQAAARRVRRGDRQPRGVAGRHPRAGARSAADAAQRRG